jgi:PAS domain S-box-containing protein
LAALVAVALRWRLSPWLDDGVPTVALLGAVAFAVWYGGIRPAISAAIVGYVANLYFFTHWSGLEPRADPRVLADTVVYLLSASLIITVGRHLRHLTRHAGAADRELRAGEERWRALLTQSTVGLAGMDLTGRFEFANDRFCEMVGRPWQDLQGVRMHEITHPEDLPHNVALFEQLAAEGTPFVIEKRYLRPDGVENWVTKSVFAIRGEDGSPRAAMAVVLDVTERQRAETERTRLLESERQARLSAEQANRMKNEFLAVLSHELRTPLSNVISWGRLLQTKYPSAEADLQRGLTVIVNNANAQAQLIADLLDLSRIAAGKLTLDAQPLDLMAVVESTVNSHQSVLDTKGLRCALKRVAEPAIVLGDSGRLQQVLWNLLSNAIKFTPTGGEIEVRVEHVGHHWELTVRDTGEGIAAEFLPHLFDRFRQADGSTARRYGGLGIGLSIVRQLVELHGGTVRAESDGPGRGARFTVQLPVHLGKTQAADPAPSEPGELALTPTLLQGLCVLAVEDQTDMRDYIQRILEEHGAVVTTACSALEALERLRVNTPRVDVLVSDIGLSGLDGYGLIRTIREQLGLGPDELKAVAVTAFARDEDRLQALGAGFQACLAKPYQVAQLVRTVRELTAPQPAHPQVREPHLRLVENKD